MKTKSMLKNLTSVMLSGTMLLMSVPFVQSPEITANAVTSCTIDTNKTYQNIRGFGGINHPEWTGQDMTAEQRQTAFGNGPNEMGLTILRVFVNPDKNQWSKALPTAQTAAKMGVTLFASPWEPPANLAESGGSNGKLHLPKQNYGAYAQHLNDFGNYMKNNGAELYSISVQNEPDYASEWTYWSTDETTDFIANYGDKITSTRLMSPESFQYSPDGALWINGGDGGKRFYTKILNNAKAMANCDLFGTHMYGTQRAWMDFPALENSGKEIWMTEVYVPNSETNSANRWPEALDVAENIHNAMVVGNMSAYTWWYIRRSYGLMTEDGQISKRGYMMSQYSKYIRPGDVRIDATESPADGVFISSYKHSDTQIEVVAINKGSDYTQNFNVSGRTITEVDRYRTSGSENLAFTDDMEHGTSDFNAYLPANSVSTFVIKLSSDGQVVNPPDNPIVDNPITPDENGYYYHDTFENGPDDWEGRGSAEATLSGRFPYKDTNALLAQKRESAWHGLQKALNTATFKGGQSFSFSVCATYLDSDTESQEIVLSLQYTDTAGEIKFARIAQATAIKSNYVQLANTNFKIPEGAENPIIYVETSNGTDNFYIDEVIVAKAGTVIDGPKEIKYNLGDINNDGVLNSIDVVLARRGISNGLSGVEKLACDVDCNGKIDAEDAILIQKFVLGKIQTFPEFSA